MPLPTAPYLLGTHLFCFRDGDAVASPVGTASRARTSNVATIITAVPHGLWSGAIVTIAGLGGTGYNQANVTVTVVNATTFTYANTGSNEGTTSDTGGIATLSGTAGRQFRPGPLDPNWIDMGVIEEAEDNLEEQGIEIFKPAPGRLRLYDELSNKEKLMLSVTCSEVAPFHIELLYRTLALTGASTQFNPLEGKARRVWAKFQRYDQDDTLRIVLDVFCKIKPSGSIQVGGSDIVKPKFDLLVLHSTLNTGSL